MSVEEAYAEDALSEAPSGGSGGAHESSLSMYSSVSADARKTTVRSLEEEMEEGGESSSESDEPRPENDDEDVGSGGGAEEDEPPIVAAARQLFAALDGDGRGHLTRDEMVASMVRVNPSMADAAGSAEARDEAFGPVLDVLDPDREDAISFESWMQHFFLHIVDDHDALLAVLPEHMRPDRESEAASSVAAPSSRGGGGGDGGEVDWHQRTASDLVAISKMRGRMQSRDDSELLIVLHKTPSNGSLTHARSGSAAAAPPPGLVEQDGGAQQDDAQPGGGGGGGNERHLRRRSSVMALGAIVGEASVASLGAAPRQPRSLTPLSFQSEVRRARRMSMSSFASSGFNDVRQQELRELEALISRVRQGIRAPTPRRPVPRRAGAAASPRSPVVSSGSGSPASPRSPAVAAAAAAAAAAAPGSPAAVAAAAAASDPSASAPSADDSSSREALAELQQKVQRLSANARAAQRKHDRLSDFASSLEEESGELKARNATLQESLGRARSECEAQAAEAEAARGTITELGARARAAEEALANERQEVENGRALQRMLRKAKEDLQDEIDELRTRIARLMEQQAEDDSAEAEEELARLREEAARVEELERALAELRVELAEADGYREELERIVEDLRAYIRSLEQEARLRGGGAAGGGENLGALAPSGSSASGLGSDARLAEELASERSENARLRAEIERLKALQVPRPDQHKETQTGEERVEDKVEVVAAAAPPPPVTVDSGSEDYDDLDLGDEDYDDFDEDEELDLAAGMLVDGGFGAVGGGDGASGMDPATARELAACARYVHGTLGLEADAGDDPMAFLGALRDGVLLAWVINEVSPSTVDVRALNTRKADGSMDSQSLVENASLVLAAAASLGLKKTVTADQILDAQAPQNHAPVARFVWDLVQARLLRDVTVRKHPELASLFTEDEHAEGLPLSLPRERLLLRWVNHHAERYGLRADEFGEQQWSTSDLLLVLHDSVKPADEGAARSTTPSRGRMRRSSTYMELAQQRGAPFRAQSKSMHALLARAGDAIRRFGEAGARHHGIATAADVVGCTDARLCMALCASLFEARPSLPELTDEELEALELGDEEDDGSREERALRMWISSSGVEMQNLFVDCRSGLALLQMIDTVEPGTVNWKRVDRRPSNKFKMVANCNYAVALARDRLKLSLVGVAGSDLHDGNTMFILAITWQLMRYQTMRLLTSLQAKAARRAGREAAAGKISDDDILAWANARVAEAGRSELRMTSFKAPELRDSLFFLELLHAVHPRLVDWDLVTPGSTGEERLLNASYAISVARKLGATLFLMPQDICDVKPRMMMALTASIMGLSL